MFVEFKTEAGSEILNTNHITKMFVVAGGFTRINMVDGKYTFTTLSMDEAWELVTNG